MAFLKPSLALGLESGRLNVNFKKLSQLTKVSENDLIVEWRALEYQFNALLIKELAQNTVEQFWTKLKKLKISTIIRFSLVCRVYKKIYKIKNI